MYQQHLLGDELQAVVFVTEVVASLSNPPQQRTHKGSHVASVVHHIEPQQNRKPSLEVAPTTPTQTTQVLNKRRKYVPLLPIYTFKSRSAFQ